MIAAILDACVLVPSVLADTLLRCAERDLYRPLWSVEILDEMRRNLPPHVDAKAAQRRVDAMRAHFGDAEVSNYEMLIPSMTNHPKDRHVLAAAVHAGADFVVTSNLRDFPAGSTLRLGVEALHPDDFLCDLLDRAPTLLAQIIAEQAAATGRGGRPRLSIADVLNGLSNCRVTRFAHLLGVELD